MSDAPSPAELIAALGLQPHPEGGHYVETFRDAGEHGGRSHATAIYFLLRAGERSHWHRVDAAESWHWYAGAPLRLQLSPEAGVAPTEAVLSARILAGERPQHVVPAGWWQAAETLGHWTLVGCVVAPGFSFAGFELAPPGWSP